MQNNAQAAWDAFRTQGYYQAKQLLPLTVIQTFITEINQLVTQQLSRLHLPIEGGNNSDVLYINMKTLFTDQATYLATLRLSAKLFSLHATFMHSNIATQTKHFGIALPAFQTTPVLHTMSPALRIQDGYYGFGVHQDWTALQSSLDTITIWIPFTNVDKNCYPLELIPGSHLKGLLSGTQTDHIVEVDPKHYNVADFIPIEAAPGDVIFMSNFTLHRSGKNGDERLRLAASMRYENAAEPTFIDRIYPFTQKRTIDRAVLFPDFPKLENVKHIYNP